MKLGSLDTYGPLSISITEEREGGAMATRKVLKEEGGRVIIRPLPKDDFYVSVPFKEPIRFMPEPEPKRHQAETRKSK